VATVSGIGQDAFDAVAEQEFHFRDDGAEIIPVTGLFGSALAWSAKCPPLEYLSAMATETLTLN